MITETPLRHQCKQCVLQTPLHFQSLKCMCLNAVIWFKILCALFLSLSLSLPLSSSSSLPPGKPKSSIKKTTWDVPAFFGCLTNRIAQEQHFTKSSITCMRLQKNNNYSSNISNKYINRISIRNIRSAPDFLSFHSWIHLYYVHTLLLATRSTC